MKLLEILIASQSLYIALTAIWPIIHMRSFVAVTGPKTDLWLVKTVGALLIPIAICLGAHLFRDDKLPALILGAGTAVAFICIDTIYATKGVISKIYLLDAAVELLFLLAWLYIVYRQMGILSA